MSKKYVIIGASAAGISTAQKIRQLDPTASIVICSDEKEIPYNKCFIADYMAGLKDEQQVYTLTHENSLKKNIVMRLGQPVVAIKPNDNSIIFADTSSIQYDFLLLATGTKPYVPANIALSIEGIFTFHTLNDVQTILAFKNQHNAKTAIVVGAGLSGLECADALQTQGLKVHVLESHERVLARHVNTQGAQFIQQKMRQQGIDFYGDQLVKEVVHSNNCFAGIVTESGFTITADILIVATGCIPNKDLAESAGVKTTEQGVLVDDHMATNIPNIYAAGDLVLVRDQLTNCLVPNRTWPDAMLQGIIAAHAMTGNPKPYPGLVSILSSAFFGIKFVSCGPVVDPPLDYERIINTHADFYHLFLVSNGYLKGFLLVGNTACVGALRKILLTQSPVTAQELINL